LPDNDLRDAKIESLSRCIDRITTHTPDSPEPLRTDHDAQDIIAVNLQRAIQILVDLAGHLIAEHGWETPSTMGGSFSILVGNNVLDPDLADRLARAVGFRNISVHEYQAIDWDRVYTIITTHLDDFRIAARALTDAWNTPDGPE
jgi:uncharacterized protein YutE (UPF0331/DUF86 family)